MPSFYNLQLAVSRLQTLAMSSFSTQHEPTAQKPASNGTNHDTLDSSQENNVHWIRDLVHDINFMFKNLDLLREDLLKIQDDVFLLRMLLADAQQTLERLKQLVPTESVPL